uniref:Uncharacterized protein n=1 Tax=Oryza nivara TaxID=4536 RepID=A0A0E0J174_ORYNI
MMPEDDVAHVVDVLDALTGAVERDGQQVTRSGLLEHRRHARGAPGRGTYWEPARDDAGETTRHSTRHPPTAAARCPPPAPSPKKSREKREERKENRRGRTEKKKIGKICYRTSKKRVIS